MNGTILEKIFLNSRVKTYVESLKMEEYDNSMACKGSRASSNFLNFQKVFGV